MKFFANIKTGEIVGTVDGFDDELISGITIVPGDCQPEDIVEEVINLGHEKEELARRIMDARDPLTIQHLKYSDGVIEMPPEEKKAVDDELAKQQDDMAKLRKDALARPSLQQQIDELSQQLKTKAK